MKFFSEKILGEIADRISDVEQRSDCELVTVFARRSDDYLYIPLLWAALAALLLPAFVLPLLQGIDLLIYAALQAVLFFIFALVLRLDAVLPHIIPRRVRRRRAEQMARTQFVSLGLNAADAPPAVLFFISFDERYVQILTNAKVPVGDREWQKVIDGMIGGITGGKLEESVPETISKIGEVLQEHCASAESHGNYFPNRLIVV